VEDASQLLLLNVAVSLVAEQLGLRAELLVVWEFEAANSEDHDRHILVISDDNGEKDA